MSPASLRLHVRAHRFSLTNITRTSHLASPRVGIARLVRVAVHHILSTILCSSRSNKPHSHDICPSFALPSVHCLLATTHASLNGFRKCLRLRLRSRLLTTSLRYTLRTAHATRLEISWRVCNCATWSNVSPADSMARHRHYHHSYDPRYSYPPPPPRESRHHARPPRLAHRTRPRWPPQPSVEEEEDALINEFGSSVASQDDEAQSRGTVDQDPLIIDVPEYNQDRRFVWVGSDSDRAKETLTPPTSDDEKTRRGRRKAPKLETTGLPELKSRQPSPYTWTKPTVLQKNRSSGEYFLSPDSLTPPPTSSGYRQPSTTVPNQIPRSSRNSSFHHASPSPRKHGFTASEGLSRDEVFVNEDLDYGEAASLRSRRPPARYSFTKRDLASLPSQRLSGQALSDPEHPKISDETRRHTDSQMDIPTDRLRKPAPLKVSSLVQNPSGSAAQPSLSRQASSDQGNIASNHSSPRSVTSSYPPSPPRSPRLSVDRSRDAGSTSASTSRPVSRERPSKPIPYGSPYSAQSLPVTDQAWNSAFASNASRRSRPPSRLASSTIPSPNVPLTPRLAVQESSPARASQALPYPDDDRTYQLMPEESEHQFFPDRPPPLGPPFMPSRPLSRSTTPVPPMPAQRSRPSLPTRNTFTEGLTASPSSPKDTRQSQAPSPTTPRSSETAATAPIALPQCPRPEYSTHHDDWYTLDGCPYLNICPSCFDKVFVSTIYRSYFHRKPLRRDYTTVAVRCGFSDAWTRLAWLLTLQRQLPSLSLFRSLAELAHNFPDHECPGALEAVTEWHTVIDRDGRYVQKFTVCPLDVRRIELLLPAFKGLFVPVPQRGSYSSYANGLQAKCSLRSGTESRFAVYMDTLVSIHETAALARRMPPDPSSFVSLVKRKSKLDECTRDDMIRNKPWHYIPALSAFTVCEDCYDDLVRPELEHDSDIAMRFNDVPQRLSRESSLGSSCQLYSPRMRRIWKKAVQSGNMSDLKEKATERKQTEDRLQTRLTEIKRRKKLLEGPDGLPISPREEYEWKRLSSTMIAIAEEWSEVE